MPAGGADAELIRLCSGFLAEDRVIEAWNADNVPDEVGEAANGRWWEYIRQIDGIPARTPDGLRAKADCTLLALDGVAALPPNAMLTSLHDPCWQRSQR
jgi:hypothetical protein